MFVNGIAFNKAALLSNNVRCITFKYSETPSCELIGQYLHIRGDTRSNINLVVSLSTNTTFNTFFESIYINNYKILEGYYYIEEREVTVNGIRIISNSLKDQCTIVSILFSDSTILYDPVSVLSGTPVQTNVFVFVTEDYLFIARRESCTPTEFANALLFAATLPNSSYFYPSTTTTKIFEITLPQNITNDIFFTTAGFVPEWRYAQNITLPNNPYVHFKYYYNYAIDFADYLIKLKERMYEILQFSIYHKSENIQTSERDVAFITYKVEFQDKPLHAMYMKIPPWDTHHFMQARIAFTFHTTDFLIYRGFINDMIWFEKLSNNLTLVCIQKQPNDLTYCATVKWGLDEISFDVNEEIENVSSDRGYYMYTVDFNCELMYFYVRIQRIRTIIQDILGLLTEPTTIQVDDQCNWIHNTISAFIYNVNTNPVTYTHNQQGLGYVEVTSNTITVRSTNQ